MQSTGATIETSYAKDQSLTFVVIGKFWNAMCIKHDSIMNSWTGKQDSVLEAKREILKRFQTQSSTTLDIPKEHHGFISLKFRTPWFNLIILKSSMVSSS